MSNTPQQQYPAYQGLGKEGAAGRMGVREAVTGVNENEAMPAGRIVVYDSGGSGDRSVKLPDATGQTVIGLTQFSQVMESYDLTGVAQVTTYTVGGTATDGDYVFNIDIGDTGENITTTVTRTGGSPASNNDIAAAARTALGANTEFAGRVQITGATADIIVTLTSPGTFSTTTSAPSPGTLTSALTTSGEADHIPMNDAANIARKGQYWARPEDAVTPTSEVHFRHTANAGTGTSLGALRGTNDNLGQVTRGDVEYNGTDDVGLYIDGYLAYVPSNTSDDQTATDLRDEIIARVALIPGNPVATVDLSGAESYIILTFADTAAHTVTSYSPATADVTSITNTQTATVRTDQITNGAKWVTSAAAGTLAILDLNLEG